MYNTTLTCFKHCHMPSTSRRQQSNMYIYIYIYHAHTHTYKYLPVYLLQLSVFQQTHAARLRYTLVEMALLEYYCIIHLYFHDNNRVTWTWSCNYIVIKQNKYLRPNNGTSVYLQCKVTAIYNKSETVNSLYPLLGDSCWFTSDRLALQNLIIRYKTIA